MNVTEIRGFQVPLGSREGQQGVTTGRSSDVGSLAARTLSRIPDVQQHINVRLAFCKNLRDENALNIAECWRNAIMSPPKTGRSRPSSSAPSTPFSRQELAIGVPRRDQAVIDIGPDLTETEVKALGRSLSSWAILGLIHQFSIFGGSPRQKVDFGQVSGIIGRNRAGDDLETKALDEYIDYCAEKLRWGFFQKKLQTFWIKTSYWCLSGVVPIIIEKTFENVLNKVRSAGNVEGNVAFVLWNLIDRLEEFLKKSGTQTGFDLDLKPLCEELSPFLFKEFFPTLTLCEDRMRKIPFLRFFSFICKPLDLVLNAGIRRAAEASFSSLLTKAASSFQEVIGGKETINYRIANPILTFLNGQLEELIKRMKVPPSVASEPLSLEVIEKLEPLVDELMNRSGIPSCEVNIPQELLDLASESDLEHISERLIQLATGRARGEERRKAMKALANEIKVDWPLGSQRLEAFAADPTDKEIIREQIRSGLLEGLYFVINYCDEKQELLLQKALHQVTSSLFSDNRQRLSQRETEKRYRESFATLRQQLVGSLAETIVERQVNKKASNTIYKDSKAVVNDHWNKEYDKITSSFKKGVESLINEVEEVKIRFEQEGTADFSSVLAKDVMLWEGVYRLFQMATLPTAPADARKKIEETFGWLEDRIGPQLDTVLSLKQEMDAYQILLELIEMYRQIQKKIDQKSTSILEKKERETAGALARFLLQTSARFSSSPKTEESGPDLNSIASSIIELSNKEYASTDTVPELKSTREDELKGAKGVLGLCCDLEGERFLSAVGQLQDEIEDTLSKYQNRSKKFKTKLIKKVTVWQEEHSKSLNKIEEIRFQDLPRTWAEAFGLGQVAAAIGKTIYKDQIEGVKRSVREELESLFSALSPIVLGNPIEGSGDESQSSDDGSLPESSLKENLYTHLERLTLSSLLSYYQSQLR